MTAFVLQQNRLRWYGHVLRKDDDDWVKKCMEYKVEGPRPRGRPKRTWREVVREDCQACKLNKEDAMDHCKWRKMIKDVRWSGWVWVGECFFWYRPTRVVPEKRLLNGCVCVYYLLPHIDDLSNQLNTTVCTGVVFVWKQVSTSEDCYNWEPSSGVLWETCEYQYSLLCSFCG